MTTEKNLKKIDYFNIVKSDLIFLNKIVHSVIPGIVGNINLIIDDVDGTIGTNIGMISCNCYYQDHVNITSKCKYIISLFDGSLICAFYDFDSNYCISSFSLSFLPSMESKHLFKKELSEYHGEYYFRIDYSPKMYVENTHSRIHAHLSLNRNDIRIPVDRCVLISDFLYFVLKNIYGIEKNIDKFFDRIRENRNELQFNCELSYSELTSFCLISNNL